MHLLADVLGLRIPGGIMPLVFIAMLNRVKDKVIFDARVGEEGLQAVIILLQNGVELMIVTARTRERESQECRADGIGDVVQDLLAALHELTSVAFIGKVPVEAGGD